MLFNERLEAARSAVEARLNTVLAQDASPAAVPDRLLAAMRHAVLGGGKRFRPFLVLESAALFDVPDERALETAAALECIHCYSLVHDDLPSMDNDALRRGLPTVWTAFDEWTAVLAGDALLTLAFELTAGPRTHPDPAVRADITLALARASGPAGMVGGQALDLAAEKLDDTATPTIGSITRTLALKTGALITFACEAGALLAEAPAEDRAALSAYGRALGLTFQIADDLLDVEGDVATVGKAVDKDAAAGKATLVSMLGVEAARARLASVQAEATAALDRFGPAADNLREAARFAANRKQ